MIGPAVLEEKTFEHCGRQTYDNDDGRRISSPCESNGSGELKKLLDIMNAFLKKRKGYRYCVLPVHITESHAAISRILNQGILNQGLLKFQSRIKFSSSIRKT